MMLKRIKVEKLYFIKFACEHYVFHMEIDTNISLYMTYYFL